MNPMQKHNLYNIQRRFEDKTGVQLVSNHASPSPSRRLLRVAILAASLSVLWLLLAFTWPLFSPLEGDALTLRAVYEGNGIVTVHVENRSHKELTFQPQARLYHWITAAEIPQKDGDILFQGTTIAPHSTDTMTLDLSQAFDMEALEQSRENDWYYLLLTNSDFLFGQEWKCSVFFGQEAEKTENSGEPLYTLDPIILNNIADELRFYFEDDYQGIFAGNPMNYEYLQKVEEYLLRSGKTIVPAVNPGLMAEAVPDGVIFDASIPAEKQYALTGMNDSLHDAFGKFVGSGEFEYLKVMEVYLPAYEGSQDQSWSLPLVYWAVYEKSAMVTGEECAFIHGQIVSFRDLSPYQIYGDDQFVCYNVTHLFYTDLRDYVENVVAMYDGDAYHYFDEQVYQRIEKVYDYYAENLSILSLDAYLALIPDCIIENHPTAASLVEDGLSGIITSDCDMEKIVITITTWEDGNTVYAAEAIPGDPRIYDLSEAAEASAAIQALEEGVYVIDVSVWLDSDTMACQSLWSTSFVTGNAAFPGPL